MSPSPFRDTDEALVERVKNGDQTALAELYEKHFEALYTFIYYRVSCNVHATEEITHDVFLAMIERLASFDATTTLN